MDINKYNLYAEQSLTNKKEQQQYTDIMVLIQKFEEISSAEDAKNYIKQTWDIEIPADKKRISDNCSLTVKENDNRLHINFVSKQENINYYYNK